MAGEGFLFLTVFVVMSQKFRVSGRNPILQPEAGDLDGGDRGPPRDSWRGRVVTLTY